MGIVVRGTWTQRRQLHRLSRRSKDAGLMRRSLVLSWLMRGHSVSMVAENLMVARSTVYRWVGWFQADGIEGLERGAGGRRAWAVTQRLMEALETLLDETPRKFGYLRTTWSSELLAKALSEHYELAIHFRRDRRRYICPMLARCHPAYLCMGLCPCIYAFRRFSTAPLL